MKFLLRGLAGLCLAGLAAPQVLAETYYNIHDLGTIDGGSDYQASAISSDGRFVVGSFTKNGNSDGFFWSAATGMVDMNPGNSSTSYSNVSPTGVNSHGLVVGSGTVTKNSGFIWSLHAGFTNLKAPISGSNPDQLGTTWATSINDNGQIVGGSHFVDSTNYPYDPGDRWDQSGNVQQSWPSESATFAINASGRVLGFQGTYPDYNIELWQSGNNSNELIGLPQNYSLDTPSGLSDNGQISGTAFDADGNVLPFYWSGSGSVQIVSIPDVSQVPFDQTTVGGINNDGVLVGHYDNLVYGDTAYSWQSGGPFKNLNDYDLTADTYLSAANAINNLGEIVGYGYINGQQRAYLATPQSVPEPISAVALGMGFVGIVRRRRASQPR